MALTDRSKLELEQKLVERTKELEDSRKAVLHMLKEVKKDVERLKEVDRLKTHFLSMVTHELKTPLTPIFEYLSLLKENFFGPLTAKQEEALTSIQKQSLHLKNLIENILEISRIEVGKELPVNKEPMAFKELIEGVKEILSFDLKNAGLDIIEDVPANLPTIFADEGAVKRVIINLVGNSLKFAPAGGKIKITAREDQGMLEVCVSDTGIGIAPENLQKVFDKFYQVDIPGVRDKGGIGMGLAIARSLVEAHGGNIWAESPGIGRGSSFFIRLPISNR